MRRVPHRLLNCHRQQRQPVFRLQPFSIDSLITLFKEVVDCEITTESLVGLNLSSSIEYPRDVLIEYCARQSVFRDTKCTHAADNGLGFEYGWCVTLVRKCVRSRQT